MAGKKEDNIKLTLTLPRTLHQQLFQLAAAASLARGEQVNAQDLIRAYTRQGVHAAHAETERTGHDS